MRDDLRQKLDKIISKTSAKHPECDTQVLIKSIKLDIDYTFSSNQPRQYHIASVGKVMTVAILAKLFAEEILKPDQQISQILSPKILQNLFEFEGQDYSKQVTIAQLAQHMSGINDYFESKSSAGSSFIDEVINNNERIWTPEDLLDYTRQYQSAISAPGQKFFYADTGYILIGLIIEKTTGLNYTEALNKYIFEPCKMKDSYLFDASNRKRPIAPLFVKGIDVSTFNSLSCDWAGGGIISTSQDLLKFQTALHQNKFGGLLELQAGYTHKFRGGMHYGFGMMQLHFNEFFFLLIGMPNPVGHIGITATHMFYDKPSDTHIIMNFGSDKRMVESFKTLIGVFRLLRK